MAVKTVCYHKGYGCFENAFNEELVGVHQDPVDDLKSGTKFSSTGLVFELKANEIRNAVMSGESYTTPLTFGGHPLGEAPDTDPANDFAAKEIGIVGQKGYESSLPETNVTFHLSQWELVMKLQQNSYEMKQPLNDDNIVYFAMKNYQIPHVKILRNFRRISIV